MKRNFFVASAEIGEVLSWNNAESSSNLVRLRNQHRVGWSNFVSCFLLSAAYSSPPAAATAASLLDKLRWWRRGAVLPVSTAHHLTVGLLLVSRVAAGHAWWWLLDHWVALAVRVLVLKVLRSRRGVAVAGSRAVVEACRTRDLLMLLGK